MNMRRVIAMAAIAAVCSTGLVHAKTLRNSDGPAEMPPPSYDKRQYVDSEGCVFVRAGIDGDTKWVPRVTRNRKVICGFKPSLPGSRRTAAKPEPAATPAPERQPERVVRRVRVTPATAQAQRQPREKTATPAPAKPAPRRVAVRTAPDMAAAPCPGRSPMTRQHMRNNAGFAVRCGPQAEPPVTPGTGRNVRIAPRHVYEKQLRAKQGVHVPEGYKPVWEDDRLNLRRAHQTPQGKARTEMMWTNTVPRRLVERPVEARPAPVARLSTRGAAKPAPTKPEATSKTRTARVSSRSARPEQTVTRRDSTASEPASHRYIRAAVYPDRAAARAAAKRLAGQGLPARLGKFDRDGRRFSMVLAGPFRSQARLDAAMATVRAAGFGNAGFIR
ncbi:SPOR domain-containing protein [Roseovarius salinarum]|uniref:SPOR domain-containing protein n=1 Tax=Roseovarius salinarum TaxID=1981892 RepID=UPI00130015DA|nr:SPOR domain-containing protein [Roseovarius salinarum]